MPQLSPTSLRDASAEKRGIKDLLLSAVAVTGGSVGLLLLLATSTQDLSWASAVVPVRLLIVLIVAWFTVGFLVIPPLFSTCHEIAESHLNPRGRTRVRTLTEEATMKLIAVQTKQLSQLEAEVVERQRKLQDLTLRLKLMTQPILQASPAPQHPCSTLLHSFQQSTSISRSC